MSIIEIEDLTKTFGPKKALNNVSLSIEEGEIFGFLGPNGAGKSTALRCLMGFIYPDQGRISVNALPIFCFVSIFSILPICALFSIGIREAHIVAVFVLCLLFCQGIFALSMAFSTWVSEKGRVYFATASILLVSYVANVVAIISDGFAWMKKISIFHYFNAFQAFNEGTIELTSFIFFL